MTCRLVDEQGSSTLKCTTTTQNSVIRGRNPGPRRVTQFADVSALNPGSTVMASIELSAGAGDATIQFRVEQDRWGYFSTGITSVKNVVVETERELVVTNNRVEFIIQGGRDVRLDVAFTNPVAPDEDVITVTKEPSISIVEDNAKGIIFTQEARIFIVGDGDEASITQEPFMSVVGDDDEISVTQEP
jgi:hypothetical protein